MNFNMRTPCSKCPFRKDIRAYLTKERVREITSALDNGGTFPCHETTEEDEDGEAIMNSKKWKFCGGAAIMLEKSQDPKTQPTNQMLRIAERLGFYDHTKLDLNAPVFDSFTDMIEAQER